MTQKNINGLAFDEVVIVDGNGNQVSAFGSTSTGSTVTAPTPVGYSNASGNSTPVTPTAGLPVMAVQGTLTDRSGTITTGGTSQTLAAINTARKYIFIENPTVATENIYINFTSAATVAIAQATATSSIAIAPGGSFSFTGFMTTELITVNAATTGHAFIAKEG